MPTELEQQFGALKVICSYLLFERKQETQLSMAFSLLIQERHNQFHTMGTHKTGDDSTFADCKSDMCMAAFNLLRDSRSMAIEINDLTVQLVAGYNLKVSKVGGTCRAWLEDKHENLTIIEGQ